MVHRVVVNNFLALFTFSHLYSKSYRNARTDRPVPPSSPRSKVLGTFLLQPCGLRQIGPIVDKQTVRRHVDGYEEEEYPDRIFIGQCETTLVQGPETDERDLSGGISSS